MKNLPGAGLVNDTDLKNIQEQIGKVRLLVDQQTADEKLLTKAKGSAAGKQNAPILAWIKARSKEIAAGDKVLSELVEKATKTYYTEAQEDAAYAKVSNTKWGEYLEKLDGGKDGLGEKKRIFLNAGGPGGAAAKDRESHAHHIVMKKGDEGAGTAAFLARSILWTANQKLTGADAGRLNPFMGLWNFAWTPNWSHSTQYAEDVLARLRKVKYNGPTAIREVLIKIAEDQIRGIWYVKGGGKGDVSDIDT